jgi:nucleotide-binding universal stress UspA family protein
MLNPIRNIVLPTDFSDCADAATERAVEFARLDGAAVHLVHAVSVPAIAAPYEVSVPGAIWEGVRKAAEERMAEAREALEKQGIAEVTGIVVEAAESVVAIREAVQAHDADLVVMGTHGYGRFKHAFLGSVAERTIRSVDCPVIAVKEPCSEAVGRVRRILVAVDFSSDSDVAVEAAVALATRMGAALDVVHAVEMPRAYLPRVYSSALGGVDLERRIWQSAEQRLAELEQKLAPSELSVTLHSRAGSAPQVISDVAEEVGCQLIVMGTRGNTGLPRLVLGSVAAHTLREAPCSVMTVTAKEPEAG